MFRRTLLLGGVSALTVAACEEDKTGVEVIENIERIFMHHRCDFTFLVPQLDSSELKIVVVAFRPDHMKVRIIRDVEPGKRPWARVERRLSGPHKHLHMFLDIHIRGVSDIEGGAWQLPSGKTTTRGSTIVVE